MDDRVEFNTQNSSQWDGFRHFPYRNYPKDGEYTYYGGMTTDQAKDKGCSKYGVQSESTSGHCPPPGIPSPIPPHIPTSRAQTTTNTNTRLLRQPHHRPRTPPRHPALPRLRGQAPPPTLQPRDASYARDATGLREGPGHGICHWRYSGGADWADGGVEKAVPGGT